MLGIKWDDANLEKIALTQKTGFIKGGQFMKWLQANGPVYCPWKGQLL
jgi:hypothetical protein